MARKDVRVKAGGGRVEALETLRRKIENAYHDRKDYPPYAIVSWEDRTRYHNFIMKILNEQIKYEGG